MKKPSITPGDWTPYKEDTTGEIWIDAVTSGEADEICQVSQASITKDEAMANAQAIAALPKLLEALEQLEAIGSGGVAMIHETGKPTWSALDEVKRITREALAAAGYTE